MNEILQRIAGTLGAGELLQSHWHHVPRMGRVLMVGGVGFIIQTTIFELFGIWLGIVAPSTATLFGGEFAILSNFFLNNRFSFRDADDASPLYKRILKFHLVSGASLATQWTCVFIAEHISQSVLFLNGAFLVGVGIGFILNYTGYYFFVWRKK
ncbi:MAG: GtrA family protein [bacterium]|nr:GtrA family protein [bacterium]